jgi:hypothetical protein
MLCSLLFMAKGGASHFFSSSCYAVTFLEKRRKSECERECESEAEGRAPVLQFVLLLLFVPPSLLDRSRSSLLLLCEVCCAVLFCSVLFKRKPKVRLKVSVLG